MLYRFNIENLFFTANGREKVFVVGGFVVEGVLS